MVYAEDPFCSSVCAKDWFGVPHLPEKILKKSA
jgi:hypothetical protein